MTVILYRPQRTDRETAAGKAQRYHTDLKLIYMLPIMPYTTSRQFRVDGHLVRPEQYDAVFTKLPHPLAKDCKNTLANS